MGRKYVKFCTNHEENKLSFPERFDISYLFHENMKCNGIYGAGYFDFVPTDRNIEWIKKYYRLQDFTEFYYDREPDVNLEYDDPNYDKVFNKLYRDDWYNRMQDCCWCEPHQRGIWGYTSDYVENVGYHNLEEIRQLVAKRFVDVRYSRYDKNSETYRIKLSFFNRMFTTLSRKRNDDYFSIYWYGRDINEVDYSWGFERK